MNIALLSKTTLLVLTVFLVGCQKDPEQAFRRAALALVDEIENAQPRGIVWKTRSAMAGPFDFDESPSIESLLDGQEATASGTENGFLYMHSEYHVDSVVYDITNEDSLVTPYKLTLRTSYNWKAFRDRSGEETQKTFLDAKNTTEFRITHSGERGLTPFYEAEYLWNTDYNTWIPVSNTVRTVGWPYDIEADRKRFEGQGDYYYHPKG